MRNGGPAHTASWELSQAQFVRHMQTLLAFLCHADALSSHRAWAGWTPTAPRFASEVLEIVSTERSEGDQLCQLQALRRRPQLSTIPFTRNPCFTGRDDVLDDILPRFLARHRAAVLTAAGGFGKTATAVEFMYRAHERNAYPGGMIVLDADSQDTLRKSVLGALRHLALTPRMWNEWRQACGGSLPDAWRFLQQWLEVASTSGDLFLLVFDNADDPDVLLGSEAVSYTHLTLPTKRIV